MAKYTINHTCGHSHTYQLVGKITDRERKAAWLETLECPACRRRREEAEAAAKAAESEFAAIAEKPLTGTAKQVAWATKIRNEVIAFFSDVAREKSWVSMAAPGIVKLFSERTSAHAWIEDYVRTPSNRHLLPPALARKGGCVNFLDIIDDVLGA